MANRVKVEVARVLGQNSNASKVANNEGFAGVAMRAAGVSGSSIPANSVVVLDTDWRDNVVQQPIANSFDDDGNQRYSKNTYVSNPVTGKAYPFYPSSLWKSIRSYTVQGDMAVAGDFINASGDVLDELGDFAEVNDALDHIAQKCSEGYGIKIGVKTVKTMPFGKRDSIEAKDLKNGSVMTFNWQKIAAVGEEQE